MKNNIIKNKIKVIAMIIIGMALININYANATTAKTNTTSSKTNTVSNSKTNTIKNNEIIGNSVTENTVSNSKTAQEKIDDIVNVLAQNGLNKTNLSNVISQYKELSKTYTNDEIADMLDNSKNKLKGQSNNIDNIDNINKILRNFNTDQLNKILNELNIDDTLNEISSGATLFDVVKKATKDMTPQDKANLAVSILWETHIFHTIIIVLAIFEIYKILVRCVIYKKAKKHAWAILIPIYRDVVMLKICKMSPWWLLLLFVPIIGWILLWLVSVASKFMLAERFGKGPGFAFGLWLLWPIFESILAFSRKTKYISEN